MGLGFGWMPSYLIERELRYSGGSRYRFTPALVHRRDAPLGRAGQRLAELSLAGRPAAPQRPGSRMLR